jgi:hypothetical protein
MGFLPSRRMHRTFDLAGRCAVALLLLLLAACAGGGAADNSDNARTHGVYGGVTGGWSRP